jgi:hypothetical protein
MAAGADAEPAAPQVPESELSLERLIPGRTCQAAGGSFYRTCRRAEEFRPAPDSDLAQDAGVDSQSVIARYRRTFFGAAVRGAPEDLDASARPLLEVDPRGITYLDIETCGLAGEPLFLVGLMRYRQNTLRVEQLLARDYSEEGPVLAAARDALADTQCLVTFNGKAFDVPFVAMRSAACGLFDALEVPAHVDLLHVARRRWRRGLPNCRLQTLEELICGRRRSGDIPGCDIPAAYHEFVRARQGADPVRRARSLRCIQTILHHNALDLVTMAELVVHVLTAAGRE